MKRILAALAFALAAVAADAQTICSLSGPTCTTNGSTGGTFTGGTITAPILFAAGTAGAPSIAWSADADGTGTGWYRSAANTFDLSINGSQTYSFGTSLSLLNNASIIVQSNSGVVNFGASNDVGLIRSAAGVLKVTTGGGGGTSGQVLIADGAAGTSCGLGFQNGYCLAASATPSLDLGTTAVGHMVVGANGTTLASSGRFMFSSGAIRAAGPDTGIERAAAAVVRADNGSSGVGWFQNSAGRVVLSSPYTNATATFSNTALSVTLTSGRKYAFEMSLFASESTAADGIAIDFNGGSATMTTFAAHCELVNNTGTSVTAGNATSAALATVINVTAMSTTSVHLYKCSGFALPSSSNTFIVRARQDTHSTGTLTIGTGSWLWVEDMP